MAKATDNFAELLDESFKHKNYEGTVVKGTIVNIEKDYMLVDVGLKSEGKIPLREFGPIHTLELKVGDVVDVYLERMENRDGEIVLSREKARREEAWEELEASYRKKERVMGVITGRIRGGVNVDLAGVSAFLPGSQIDVRPTKDIYPLMNIEQPFMILGMDRLRGNIVVSRKAILQESQAESRSEIMANLTEGKVVEGTVKNVTDYGAFIDLGGIDALLHVTDIAWDRIGHPNTVLKPGQLVKVKITKISDNNRISVGMKQLTQDPWLGVAERYVPGTTISGKVSNIMDYGVFVLLEPGVEGLIHASELSWTKKNIHPSKIVSVDDALTVKVLEVDGDKRRVSLSLRQCAQNPWITFAEKHPVGSTIEGEVKNFTEFGMFVGVDGNVDGMVHINDLSWDKSGEEALALFKKGQTVKVKVLDVAPDKERISLGIKQLEADPFASIDGVSIGDVLTCTVKEITDQGIQVITDKDIPAFIRKTDLAKDRAEQKPERFAVEERVDAQVISIDKKSRKLILSIKAREVAEEKKAMAEYGSSDSGASLGDILGAAINLEKVKASASKKDAETADEPKEKKKAKAKADAEAHADEKPAKKSKAKKEAE